MAVTALGGLVLILLSVVVSTVLDGNSFGPLLSPSSFVLVFFATVGASVFSYELADLLNLPKAMARALKSHEVDLGARIELYMRLADAARRDGLLALDGLIDDIEDGYVRYGLRLVTDGADESQLKDELDAYMGAIEERHAPPSAMLRKLSGYAPAFGMVGTVIGLVNMLGAVSSPDELGKGMALALLTTLYGVVLANMVVPALRRAAREAARRRDVGDGVRHRRDLPAADRDQPPRHRGAPREPAAAGGTAGLRRTPGEGGMSRRRRKEAPPDDSGRWMATYGDMVTLLMAFFVMMFAISSIQEDKFQAFLSGLGQFGNPGNAAITVGEQQGTLEPVSRPLRRPVTTHQHRRPHGAATRARRARRGDGGGGGRSRSPRRGGDHRGRARPGRVHRDRPSPVRRRVDAADRAGPGDHRRRRPVAGRGRQRDPRRGPRGHHAAEPQRLHQLEPLHGPGRCRGEPPGGRARHRAAAADGVGFRRVPAAPTRRHARGEGPQPPGRARSS